MYIVAYIHMPIGNLNEIMFIRFEARKKNVILSLLLLVVGKVVVNLCNTATLLISHSMYVCLYIFIYMYV